MERHEITSGQLYSWRQQAMSGELSGRKIPAVVPAMPMVPHFAEVAVEASPMAAFPVSTTPKTESKIGIELPSGVKLSVDSDVDSEALARVLGILSR